ncbi:unnamed protein product, partial [Ectocarpus sp. 8 AP-2014]
MSHSAQPACSRASGTDAMSVSDSAVRCGFGGWPNTLGLFRPRQSPPDKHGSGFPVRGLWASGGTFGDVAGNGGALVLSGREGGAEGGVLSSSSSPTAAPRKILSSRIMEEFSS